jgi:V-type H+-transporting ATPase subunit C
MGHEYWLTSVPVRNETCDETWKKLALKTQSLSSNAKFQIPDLKVGTLDTLVALSDDLFKYDNFVESVVRKIAQTLGSLLEGHDDRLDEALTAEGKHLDDYITHFQWDIRKYLVKTPTRELADGILKSTQEVENDLKERYGSYTQVKNSLSSIERNQSGSLLTRSLVGVVKREHAVIDSEYLTTLFAAVPLSLERKWIQEYEKLADMVVPRSSVKVTQDSEYALFSVVLFKRVAEEFKHHAREAKFIVRDFDFDDNALATEDKEKEELDFALKKQWAGLIRWGKAHFSETFTAWIHLKAIRLFVESVLRYGLPPQFQGAVVVPHRKHERKARDALRALYAHLDPTSQSKGNGDAAPTVEIAGVGSTEYYPYVSFTFKIDFVTHK